jgi:endo-1,4-beta-xylanase
LRTKLLQSLALGLSFGLVFCGSADNSPTGGDDTSGATGGTGGSEQGSGGTGTTAGGGNNAAAAGDASSTGGTTATGGSGSGNAGMGGKPNGGNAGSGGASMGGAGGGAAGGGGTSSTCMSGTPPTGGTQHCSSNAQGSVGGGYSYSIWSSGSGGCITPYGVGAAFKATWNNSANFLARVGLAFGSDRTPDQIGTFSADYAETKTGTDGGASFIGIYGWSENPLHEYYIVDDWFGSRPNWGEKVGTTTVDGGTYDILTHTQVNQPSITGSNATFVQFWSMRQTARQCGHISISEHFKAWANLGMTLGKMEECRIVVEVVGGSGSIDFTSATVVAK